MLPVKKANVQISLVMNHIKTFAILLCLLILAACETPGPILSGDTRVLDGETEQQITAGGLGTESQLSQNYPTQIAVLLPFSSVQQPDEGAVSYTHLTLPTKA